MSKIIPEWQAYDYAEPNELGNAIYDNFKAHNISQRYFRDPEGKIRIWGRVRVNVVFEGAPYGSAIEL